MPAGRKDTFKSKSPSLGVGLDCGTDSSVARPVSSMSVVSVPFEDVAMGDGSAMSLGLEANGEDWLGGCRKFEWSVGLGHRFNIDSTGGISDTYIEETIGDPKGRGELGESVYGENADIRLLFGEGSIGDLSAIIMIGRG